MTTNEFLSAFHSLDGITIAERKKNLFKLLHQNRNSAIDLPAIRPSTALEETFQADAVIFFKNHAEMLKLLNNENAAVIGKVLKDDWFIRHICENVTGERLVTEIFPNISYNVKLKLLSRLAVILEHPSRGDEYFHSVMESYGLYFAAKLLPSCSEDLILKTLEMKKVELTPKQLLLTIQRNPSQTLSIIEKLRNSNVDLYKKYKYVFRHLMKTNPSIVIELGDTCRQCFRLGKRATRRFLFSNKALFVEHVRKLHSLLVEDEIGRCLPKEMGGVFSSLLPKSVKDFWNNLDERLSLLDALSSNGEKLEILLHAFEERYGADLLSFSELLVPKVFQWMSPDFKRNWMQTHSKPKGLSEEMWVSFMNCDESIGILKKKLSCASNLKDRAKFVTALVRTCKVNNDLAALADVCEYVASKHKNDHISVKVAFFETLHQEFKLKTLGEEHWKPLKQLIQLCGVNYSWSMEKFIVALVYFSLRNDQPIEEHLKLYVKISYGRYNVLCFNLEYEKRCLNTFYEILPSCYEDKELKDYYVHFLHCIYRWNIRHPKARMSVFSFKAALEALMATLPEIGYYSTSCQVAIDCVLNEYDKACEVNLVELLFANRIILPQLTKVIKCYPWSMFERLESFTQNMFECYISLNSLQHLFRNVADSNLRQQIAEICKEKIDSPTGGDRRRFAMYILSFVSTSEDFVTFTEQFFPKESVANLEDPNYNLQQAIPSCFRYFNHAFAAFDPILRFCEGDYMKFAQKSLYHIAHNTAERRLPSFLNKLGERAVSVRKHSVYLSLKLLSNSSTNSVLANLTNSEKNASIRKSLLQSGLNNFLRNPDAYMWEFVQQLMTMVDVDDVDAFKVPIVRLKRVSKQCNSDYILFTWKSLDRLASAEVIEENRCKILAAICSEYIALLPEDFCMDLVRAHLFTSNTGLLQERMCSFTSSYLLNSKLDSLPKIFSIIRDGLSVYPKTTCTLISELCTSFINCKFVNDAVFIQFVKLWDNSVKPFEALPEHIHLHFTLMLLNFRNQSAVEVGNAISKFYLELHDEDCGDLDEMKKCFRDEFKDHLLSHLSGSDEENHMIIIENVVNYKEGPPCLALGLSLLPNEVLPLPKVQKIYNAVIEKASKCSNPCVQIALRKHLINKE